MKKIAFLLLCINCFFPQVNLSFEFNGQFENDKVDSGVTFGYDKIKWQRR